MASSPPLTDKRCRIAAEFDLAPAAARRPEIDRVSVTRGLKTDLADALVEGQPAIRVEQRVARQRARIVAAALDIVPRIAARAVVARAGGAHDGQAFLDKSARR